jgi:hypothetical protein
MSITSNDKDSLNLFLTSLMMFLFEFILLQIYLNVWNVLYLASRQTPLNKDEFLIADAFIYNGGRISIIHSLML